MEFNAYKVKKISALIVLFLLPLLLVYSVLLVKGIHLTECIPVSSDELWWWQQAAGTAAYGHPLGYFGYDGGTPQIGTFATWGPFIVLPYALWGKVFGWEYYSYIYANCFYMGAASVFFCILLRMKTKRIWGIVAAECLMFVKIFFSATAMAECVRYALGIVAIALIFYLHENKKRYWWIRYIVVPLYFFYITLAYQIFAIFFFLWIFVLLEGKNKIFRWGAALGGMGAGLLISRNILHLFTSPYVASEENAGILEKVKGNLIQLYQTLRSEDTFFAWYDILILVLLILAIAGMFFGNKKKEKFSAFVGFILLGTFVGGHIVLYNTTSWTFVRGLNVAVVLCVYAICYGSRRRDYLITSMMMLIGWLLVSSYAYEAIVTMRRVPDPETRQYLETTREDLGEIVIPDENVDPWENTVATYQVSGAYISLVLPTGIANNAMVTSKIFDDHAKYAAVGKGAGEEYLNNLLPILEQNGYILLYENERLLFFGR